MRSEFIFGKLGLVLTFAFGSMSLLDLKETLQIFCLAGTLFSSFAAGIYYSIKAVKESKKIKFIEIINYLKNAFKSPK